MGVKVQDTEGAQFRVIDPPRVSQQPVPPTRMAMFLGQCLLRSRGCPGDLRDQRNCAHLPGSCAREAIRRPVLGMFSMVPTTPLHRQRRRMLFASCGLGGSLQHLRDAGDCALVVRAATANADEPDRKSGQAPGRTATGGCGLTPMGARRARGRIAPLPTPERALQALDRQRGIRRGRRQTGARPRSAPRTEQGGAERSRFVDPTLLAERGFVSPDMPQARIAHEFRVLKRPIIRNAQVPGRVKSATARWSWSPVQCRAKARLSSQRILPLAWRWSTTIPCCWSMATSRTLRYPRFSACLKGRAAGPADPGRPRSRRCGIADQPRASSFLPAGTRHRRATELLASERMSSLLQRLASRYPDRIIIFDSPPLLATTEARILATYMGQVVMVVAADATPRHVVNQALCTIEQCEVVLMLLNKATGPKAVATMGTIRTMSLRRSEHAAIAPASRPRVLARPPFRLLAWPVVFGGR